MYICMYVGWHVCAQHSVIGDGRITREASSLFLLGMIQDWNSEVRLGSKYLLGHVTKPMTNNFSYISYLLPVFHLNVRL